MSAWSYNEIPETIDLLPVSVVSYEKDLSFFHLDRGFRFNFKYLHITWLAYRYHEKKDFFCTPMPHQEMKCFLLMTLMQTKTIIRYNYHEYRTDKLTSSNSPHVKCHNHVPNTNKKIKDADKFSPIILLFHQNYIMIPTLLPSYISSLYLKVCLLFMW